MTALDTTPAAGSAPDRPAAPGYRHFAVSVRRTARVGASFVRITFTGEDLAVFGCAGADQRVKLLLPVDGRPLEDAPAGDDWYLRWRATPEERRPHLRTYTVRQVRPAQRELDVDFVLHGSEEDGAGAAGPASAWAATAAAGDRVLLVGPDCPGAGRAWGCEFRPPADAGHLLLVGDETAVPAVCAVLEQLPAGTEVTALLEVPEEGDALDVTTAADARVHWLPRRSAAGTRPRGEALALAAQDAVRALRPAARRSSAEPEDVDVDAALLWDVPEEPRGELYAWLAGEAGVVRDLRRHLVRDAGLPRSSVAFMGYWRQGRSEVL